MRTTIFVVTTILALSSLSGVAYADTAPSCKCDVGTSNSARGPAAACVMFGLSMLVLGRKHARKH